MAFKIVVSPSAQNDIETAIGYYLEVSEFVPSKFIYALEKTYSLLSHSPYFSIRYKDFRAVPVKGFPFMLFYKIDSAEVIIYACFHTAKNPVKYPKP